MLETSFGTLRLEILPTVYEPAEDSFLLATYASSLSGRVLDLGTGSGIVALAAAAANPQNKVMGVDINPEGVKCAKANAAKNNIKNAEFFISDLFSKVNGKFDFVLFNPPYLPTSREERLLFENENASYDAGASGLEVFYRFSERVADHLASGGKTAVIATSLGEGIEKTLSRLEKRVGPSSILAQEEFFFEKIALVEAVKV